jgi:hypothetical protein
VKNRVFMLGPILAARISSPEEGTIGGRIVGRCASASVTLADGTTLPLIGGTSVAHQDRSDLEVTFAPAGAIAAGLMRHEKIIARPAREYDDLEAARLFG